MRGGEAAEVVVEEAAEVAVAAARHLPRGGDDSLDEDLRALVVSDELEHAERVERLEDADLERAVRLRERGGRRRVRRRRRWWWWWWWWWRRACESEAVPGATVSQKKPMRM